jgi:toxin CcdB
MSQFDLFVNPISRARKAYPFVVLIQSDVADTGPERIVAPLAPRSRLQGTTGRLAPTVSVDGVDHVILVPRIMSVRVDELRTTRGSLATHRNAIVAALDFLFLGV